MGIHGDKDVKYVGDSRVVAGNKPNYPKDYSEFPGKTEPFWPNFLLKEWMTGSVVLIGFLMLTISHDAPLQTIADPTDTAYFPVPDWYFMFLFELLKYTYASGPYTLLGTAVIPGLAFTALLLAPWLDTGPERRWYKRPLTSGLMFCGILSIFFLTWLGVEGHDWEQNKLYAYDAELVEIDKSTEGYAVYEVNGCINCHGGNLYDGAAGPAIHEVGTEKSEDEIRQIIVDGPGAMPAYAGTEEDLDILVEWLAGMGNE